MDETLLHDSALARSVRAFCLDRFIPPPRDRRAGFRSDPRWRELSALGTALWLDTGDLDAARALWSREFVALTTNNTLLNKEVQKGQYDELVPEAARLLRQMLPGIDRGRLLLEVAFVLNAVHALKLVAAFDADVSVELHTALAYDPAGSYEFGRRYAAIHPERFIVKVPLTPEGILAARRLVQDGIRVNFTLGFSARQNHLIASLAAPAWVNVFMGRLNSFVADNGLGDGRNFGEKATLASQRNLRELRRTAGVATRQIGASMRSGRQCIDLAGLDVFTMPVAAAKEFHAATPPPPLADRTGDDPPVALAGGRSVERERLDLLWAVPQALRSVTSRLLGADLDRATAGDLRSQLAEAGAGDLFPRLTPAELATLRADGKIPQYAKWAPRVQQGSASWDGLLTAAALESFAQDQQALDDRVAGLV
jgi:transaldolase